jgi:uncharacterized membrane protein
VLLPILAPAIAFANTDGSGDFMTKLSTWWDGFYPVFMSGAQKFGAAALVLFAGWFISKFILAKITYSAIKRTKLGPKIGEVLGLNLLVSKDGSSEGDGIERFFAALVFWAGLLTSVIAALSYAGLGEAAEPVQNFLNTITGALPLIGKALIFVAAGVFAGTILRKLCLVALGKWDDKLKETAQLTADEDSRPLSKTVGTIAFWLATLFGLSSGLEATGNTTISEPLKKFFEVMITQLPLLAYAAAILFLGYIFSHMLKTAFSSLLAAVGLNRIVERIGLGNFFAKKSASDVVGIIAQVFIMLQAFILAFEKLQLSGLSQPLKDMVGQFWSLLPSLLVAVVMVTVGVLIGRLLRTATVALLDGLQINETLAKFGIALGSTEASGSSAVAASVRTPTQLVGMLVQFGVVLVALVQALQKLALTAWADLVNHVLAFAVTKGVVALLILTLGFAVANFVRDMLQARFQDDRSRAWTGEAARVGILVFIVTMALQQLQVAHSFVLLTFGVLLGGLVLAAAIAFGLGARETASEIVKSQFDKANDRKKSNEGSGDDS